MNSTNYNYDSVQLKIAYSVNPVNSATAKLPHIPGRIVGFSTSTRRIGGTSQSVKLQITDGGNDTHRPFATDFSDTSARSSFFDGLVPLDIPNPGQIEATISIAQALNNGEEIIVDILIVSKK